MSDYNLIDFRTAIRTDLADPSTFWSNAQIDRAVVRAVADLSRFLPKEAFKEYTLNFTITAESITSLATTNLTAVVNAQSIDVAEGNTLAIGGQPDLPRPLIVTITDADNSTYNLAIIIRGLDKDNKAISETFRYSRGGSKTITGKKEFKYVHEVELDQDQGSHAGDTASVGYGDTFSGWVFLANKPVKEGSVVVTSSPAGTTHTLGTNYKVDYANGKIQLISTTPAGMIASTTYLVTYTKSKIMVDISELADLISVLDIEYPYGGVPQTGVSHGVFGNIITVEGGEAEGQADMSENDHIAIRYLAAHPEPTAYYPSTYPAFLDQTVCQLSEAYLMFMMAYKYEQQAVTDFASARTAILIANVAVSGHHVLAKAALALAGTQLNSSVVAGLFTKVDIALDAVATELGLVDTYLTGATAPSTKKYLDDGDAFINTVNIGASVPENYANFAARASELSSVLLAQANAYVSEATVRLSESDRWQSAAAGYIAQANGYLDEVRAYLEEVDRDILLAQQNLTLADRFRTDAIEKRNEVWTIWRDKSQYVGDLSSIALRQPAQQTG